MGGEQRANDEVLKLMSILQGDTSISLFEQVNPHCYVTLCCELLKDAYSNKDRNNGPSPMFSILNLCVRNPKIIPRIPKFNEKYGLTKHDHTTYFESKHADPDKPDTPLEHWLKAACASLQQLYVDGVMTEQPCSWPQLTLLLPSIQKSIIVPPVEGGEWLPRISNFSCTLRTLEVANTEVLCAECQTYLATRPPKQEFVSESFESLLGQIVHDKDGSEVSVCSLEGSPLLIYFSDMDSEGIQLCSLIICLESIINVLYMSCLPSNPHVSSFGDRLRSFSTQAG